MNENQGIDWRTDEELEEGYRTLVPTEDRTPRGTLGFSLGDITDEIEEDASRHLRVRRQRPRKTRRLPEMIV